ncbi:MAG: carbonic anhydrase family protein [Ideonella sp.]|nr:carbonic anhydrase family protein [Ideonella sp.]
MAPPRISSHPILVWCGAALLAGCGVATAATGPAWQYSGEYGPEQWARMRPEWTLCGSGQRQSPVDITSAQRQSGAMLGFHYRPEALRIVNDGHHGARALPQRQPAVARPRGTTLQQFHFHTPGGDRLNGEDFPWRCTCCKRARRGNWCRWCCCSGWVSPTPRCPSCCPGCRPAACPSRRWPAACSTPRACCPDPPPTTATTARS